MNGFFKGMKEGWEEVKEQTPEQLEQEKIEKKNMKMVERQRAEMKNLDFLSDELGYLLCEDEELLYVYTFVKNKMIITDKKLIYMDLRVAKHKTFTMIPFNKITSYSLLVPTGLSVRGKLQIFTGGDTPSLEIESAMNEGINEFCTILSEHI